MEGERVAIASPRDAIDRGIGMVHQHFMLIPVMTVAENIVLGTEPTRRGRLDLDGAEARVRELSERFGLAVRPEAVVETIERGAAAARGDPQGALPRRAGADPRRADRRADPAGGGRAVRHDPLPRARRDGDHLDHPQAGRGARRGRPHHRAARGARRSRPWPTRGGHAGRAWPGSWSDATCSCAWRGAPRTPGEPVLEVEGLAVRDERGLRSRARPLVRRPRGRDRRHGRAWTATVRASSSRRSAGCATPSAGRIDVGGTSTGAARAAASASDAGVGHIPEDRQRHGLVLDFSLAENIALHDYDEPPNSRLGWLSPRRLVARARACSRIYDVRGGGPGTPRSRSRAATSRRS